MRLLLEAIGVNKWLAYMIVGLTLLSSVSILYLKVRNSGRDTERLRQAEASLERMQKNAQIRASVERATTSSARIVLKNRYGLGKR